MLFDVVSDPSEKNDLSSRHPEIVQELAQAFQEYVKDIPQKARRGPGGSGGGGGGAGDASAANQVTGNASLATLVAQTDAVESLLANVDGKLPTQVAGKVPVQTDERPSASAAAITPSDVTNFAGGVCRGIYVGGTGNITAIVGGSAILFTAVPAGMILPIAATRVNATATTATAMVALY
jgi:hypothetical protein